MSFNLSNHFEPNQWDKHSLQRKKKMCLARLGYIVLPNNTHLSLFAIHVYVCASLYVCLFSPNDHLPHSPTGELFSRILTQHDCVFLSPHRDSPVTPKLTVMLFPFKLCSASAYKYLLAIYVRHPIVYHLLQIQVESLSFLPSTTTV